MCIDRLEAAAVGGALTSMLAR